MGDLVGLDGSDGLGALSIGDEIAADVASNAGCDCVCAILNDKLRALRASDLVGLDGLGALAIGCEIALRSLTLNRQF